MSELISIAEFAKRKGVSLPTVYDAVKSGRIVVQPKKPGLKWHVIDWETQSVMFDANNMCLTMNPMGNNQFKKKTQIQKQTKEKHIGSTDIQDTNDYQVENNDNATYEHIPESDLQDAPPKNSVAYQQYRKLAIDFERNKLKLGQEAEELIRVEDAQALFCEKLAEIADNIQNIPARVVGLVSAIVRSSVKNVPDNMDSQIFNVLTSQCKQVLVDVIRKKDNVKTDTKEFLEDARKKRRK